MPERHEGCHDCHVSNPKTLQNLHCPNDLIAAPGRNRQGHQFIIHHLTTERFGSPVPQWLPSTTAPPHIPTTAIHEPSSEPSHPYLNATSYPEVMLGERRQSQVICQFSEHRQRTDLRHISRVGLDRSHIWCRFRVVSLVKFILKYLKVTKASGSLETRTHPKPNWKS